jgi:hypothetical protein
VTLRPTIVVLSGVLVFAASAAGVQQSMPLGAPDRIERLRAWLEAVDRHEPGEPDESLLRVASWDRATLWRVWIDLGAIVSLVREPDVLAFSTPLEPEPFSGIFRLPQPRLRTRVVPYSRGEVKQLQLIAGEVVTGGGEDPVLKRGAVLHSDIAIAGSQAPAPTSSSQRPPSTSSIMLYLADGRQTGVEAASVHWEMGRRLLDKVWGKGTDSGAPNPGSDETVRLWYLAANAHMQAAEQLDPWHVDRSVQLFPRDPEMLFFAACAREMFSSPQIQNVLQSTTLPRTMFDLVGSEDNELRNAERLFRQSLERDPDRAEARIRLGRVLGRRARHQEALVELRRATMRTRNRLLLYYGNMFLGAAADASSLTDEARKAYERAAELYPQAQSPRLVLSSLAARSGDRAGALSAIESMLDRDEPERTADPWWSYYTSQSRDLEGVMMALRQAIAKGRQ